MERKRKRFRNTTEVVDKKRSRSTAGVVGKKRSRSTAGVFDGFSGGEASVQSASQPDLGVPGVMNGFADQGGGLHQEEEREDIVLLNEDELEMEQDDLVPGSGKSVEHAPAVEAGRKDLGSDLKKKRLSSVVKGSGKRKVQTYDELIEGPGGVGASYDDLDFKFEIPKEVEEFEVRLMEDRRVMKCSWTLVLVSAKRTKSSDFSFQV